MSELQPIIIKKKKIMGGGHHGGAWKVAYADFVTAMMAFFLLMWLLNSTSDEQKMGLADYFSPTISITSRGSGASGLMDGGDVVAAPDNSLQVIESGEEGPEDGKTISEEYSEMTSKKEGDTDFSGTANEDDANQKAAAEQEVIFKQETAQFESAAAAIQAAVDTIPEFQDLKESLHLSISDEGLKIQLTDQDNYSMFESGSNVMKDESKALINMLSMIIKDMPNKITISGHTDSVPFRGENSRDNWDLSTERANASRRVLINSGIEGSKIAKVVGKADTEPLDKENPELSKNRRIEIILKRLVTK